jgi:hypothetical protein
VRSRIRTIKPEAATDEVLWDLAQETGLPVFQAFVMLWCMADREGRFEWRVRALKLACLPYWDGDFSRVLDALVTRGFLVRYESQGREYGLVRTFKKHQNLNGKEPASALPAPPDSLWVPESSRVTHTSSTGEARVADAPIPSLPIPDPIPFPEQGGAGGSGLQDRARAALRDPTRSSFEKPWEWSEVQMVFAAFQKTWRRALGPVKAGVADPRVRTILERFQEGYTVDELTTAIRGSVKSENLQENPEHQTIQTVLRDGGQIDKWTALLTVAPSPKRNGREQPKAPNEDFDRRRAKREAEEFSKRMDELRRQGT